MDENEMRLEVEGVLEQVSSDLIFYLVNEYTKEEGQAWAKVFKETFSDMVDSIIEGREDEEE